MREQHDAHLHVLRVLEKGGRVVPLQDQEVVEQIGGGREQGQRQCR